MENTTISAIVTFRMDIYTANNFKRSVKSMRTTFTDETKDDYIESWIKDCIEKEGLINRDPSTYGYEITKLTDKREDCDAEIPLYLMPSGRLISDYDFCCMMLNVYGDKIITNKDAESAAFEHYGNGAILILPSHISATAINQIRNTNNCIYYNDHNTTHTKSSEREFKYHHNSPIPTPLIDENIEFYYDDSIHD